MSGKEHMVEASIKKQTIWVHEEVSKYQSTCRRDKDKVCILDLNEGVEVRIVMIKEMAHCKSIVLLR